MNYALTVYPLSNGFRRRLSAALATEPVYLTLADLRQVPVGQAIRRLRSLSGVRLVIPLEDENSRCILPLLKAVASISNAAEIEIRDHELRSERVSRTELLRDLAALGMTSVGAVLDALGAKRDLSSLTATPRIEAQLSNDAAALYVNANLWFGVKAGGSIGHIAGVVNALNELGQPVVYASAGGRTMIRSEVPHVALETPRLFAVPHELNTYVFHRKVTKQLARRTAPRFIYQRMSVGNFSGVELSRAWGVPLVLEYNGSEVWIASNWGRPLRFHRLASEAEEVCLRHAHVVVTISEALRDELLARGVEERRIVCYPNCIDPMVFDPSRFGDDERAAIRQKHGVSADAVLATFIGTFGHWHGVDVLARAIRQLITTDRAWLDRSKLRFLLVGDGMKMPIVRDTLNVEGAERYVVLSGLVPQAEAPGYLAASDILLSPHVANADGSRFFGSPTKLFEYMAMGKAIVASDLDQIGHVLRNSVTADVVEDDQADESDTRVAMLCAPGDVDGLVDALKAMAAQPEWRRILGRNARAEALARYTWRHHTEAIVERLKAVTAPRSL